MKIALIGYGKMGREIEAVAREQGDTIGRVFEIDSPVRPQDWQMWMSVSISQPRSPSLSNIRCGARGAKGYRGGHYGLGQASAGNSKTCVKDSGFCIRANFSLGMNIFFRIVGKCSRTDAKHRGL